MISIQRVSLATLPDNFSSNPFSILYSLTFRKSLTLTTRTTAVIITRIRSFPPGNTPAVTSLIESIAILKGFIVAGTTSHSGIDEYGIIALEVKKSGMVIIAVTAA